MFGLFGPRLSSLFKSRWMALIWAAIVLWTAIDFVGTPKDKDAADGNASNATVMTDESGAPVTREDVATLKRVIDGQ